MIGLISVVASLLVVAYEIRQTNQIAIVTAEIELRNNYSDLNELMATDRDLIDLLVKVEDPKYEMSRSEFIRLRSFGFRFLNIWIASEIAYENDMLPESSFQVVLDDIDHTIRDASYMQPVFKEIVKNYPGWSKTRVVRTIEQSFHQSN